MLWQLRIGVFLLLEYTRLSDPIFHLYPRPCPKRELEKHWWINAGGEALNKILFKHRHCGSYFLFKKKKTQANPGRCRCVCVRAHVHAWLEESQIITKLLNSAHLWEERFRVIEKEEIILFFFLIFCLLVYLFLRFFLRRPFFLMWTIFKFFIKFVTILLLFYLLVFWPQDMWDVSPLTRDQTHSPCIERRSLNHWTWIHCQGSPKKRWFF